MESIGSSKFVTDHWTDQGIYSGQVKQVGRSKFDLVLEGKGRCVLEYPNKVITYDGSWQNDKKHGYGILKTETKGANPELIEKTEGNWADGKLHGFCF